MKKIILIILGMVILSSCASSNGHCDAYGNKSGSIDTNEEHNS